MIDAEGNFIGLNTLIYSRSGGSAGIGFAIPSQLALSVLEEIIATGRVTRGWLGVELASTPSPGNAVGLEITRVLPGGPANEAGLRAGDLLVAINRQPASNSSVVSRQIAHTSPGTDVTLEVLRDGVQVTLVAQSGERPQAPDQ